MTPPLAFRIVVALAYVLCIASGLITALRKPKREEWTRGERGGWVRN